MTGIAPFTRAAARRLRHQMTPHEKRLWRQLHDLNLRLGLHFRRQAPVGRYIADFADLGRRLVIEVDGGQHGADRDVERDLWFAGQEFTVLRFWNNDVDSNLEGVMQIVLDAVEAAPPPPPSPTRGEQSLYLERQAPNGEPGTSPPPRGEGMGVGGAPNAGRTP